MSERAAVTEALHNRWGLVGQDSGTDGDADALHHIALLAALHCRRRTTPCRLKCHVGRALEIGITLYRVAARHVPYAAGAFPGVAPMATAARKKA